MPAATTITINDGKATPVPHSFEPISVQNGVAQFAEPSADGSLSKRNQLTYTQKLPGKGRSTVLEQGEIVLPYIVTESVNGIPRELVHSNVRVVIQVVSHPDVPKAIVTDARALGASFLNNPTVKSAMDDRVGIS